MLRVREWKSLGKSSLAGHTLLIYGYGNLLGTVFHVFVLFEVDRIINREGIKIRKDLGESYPQKL